MADLPFENAPCISFDEDSEIWHNLKEAIAASSGFQRWQIERGMGDRLSGLERDAHIRLYLRETLETLAY